MDNGEMEGMDHGDSHDDGMKMSHGDKKDMKMDHGEKEIDEGKEERASRWR